MKSRWRNLVTLAAIAWVFLQTGSTARAGMGSPTLADVARVLTLTHLTRQRLEVMSFFWLCLLLCAGLVQWIWNSLRKDFTVLPRLSYAKALGVVFLWGLLFVLVLTMISGARELMTPGAWEKRGMFYQLTEDQPPPAARVMAPDARGQ